MAAIVEEKYVPIIQVGGMMLMGNYSRSPFPTEGPGGLIDDAYCVGAPKAYQKVAIGRYIETVLVGPLLPVFQLADDVFFGVQMSSGS